MSFYKKIIKPIAFSQDAERVHEKATALGKSLGNSKLASSVISSFYNYENKKLEQKILNINFKNPVGLAAGFDYEAKLTQIIPHIGFGFMTIGSITLGSYEGNTPPRLGRLPKSKSLLVNKGLKTIGTKKILESLKNKELKIPLGISVAKTNCKKTAEDEKAIQDYVGSFRLIKKYNLGDYYELNISCPNAFGGEAFTTPEKLNLLLKEIDKLRFTKPLFLKMPVDFSASETKELCETAKKYNVQGLILGNLTKNRNNHLFDKEEIQKAGNGNFSGLPTKDKSNELIRFAYKNYKDRFVIIGCGGIFSAEDAYEKIKNGASIVQLITGMIYEGPALIKKINKGLTSLLEKDGYKNISEAIGANCRN